ncbi:polysaccharide deacetylase family protein [Ferruginibacter sp. SUN106]|uniref:polysaccharide deacetylase family protein n=1 Tax=Ferruginibacter sp. SUN106 TaxID=2978348 RepID=UPI003D36B67B
MIAPHFWRESKAKFFRKDLFFITTPWWLRRLFPGCLWDIKTKEKEIYISFDDGPHPTITPFVLAELKKYNAKATFFCIGDNVKKFPQVYQQVIDEGHAIGNHTMHHINGWKTSDDDYLNDIATAGQQIHSKLFRPPYGRVTRSQLRKLHNDNVKIQTVMWSVLAGDWIATLAPEKCFCQVRDAVYPGCIIVFHDSEKANDRMSYALPKLLEHFTARGYLFKKIVENTA